MRRFPDGQIGDVLLDRDLTGRVTLHVSPDNETIRRIITAASLFASASEYEGFGLVALEALAADLPVVASDLPVFREFLADGRDALLPPVGDPVALADALERVMADPGLRAALVEGGRAVVPAFRWSESARRHAEIYAGLC